MGSRIEGMSERLQRILILGAHGRLAGSLLESWRGHHWVTALARPELDVSDLEALRRILESAEFDVLVNGTGLTNVDRCESARDEASLVNDLAPGVMAECAARRGARLIHFSTDYVFDGKKRAPYTESDPALPKGWYGETKLAGEQRVLAADAKHLVVRVSWVFGPEKPSFVDSILQRAMTHERVEAIGDKISSPTSAQDMAQWLAPFLQPAMPGGLYHACNKGDCSWQEYATKALEIAAGAGMSLRTTTVEAIPLLSMKQFIAHRPVFSILSTAKFTSTTGLTPRHWHDALSDYILKKYAPISPQP